MASLSYWFLSPSLVLAMIGKLRGWDKERAARWNADAEIQALLKNIAQTGRDAPALSRYSPQHRDALLGAPFDRVALAAKGLAYERLDQLTVDLLLGVR